MDTAWIVSSLQLPASTWAERFLKMYLEKRWILITCHSMQMKIPREKILSNYYTQPHTNQTQISTPSTVKQTITQRNHFLSQWACCVCPCMCAQAQARICSRSVSSDPHRILKLSILITFLHNFAHSPLTTLAYAISFWGRIKSELASTFFNQWRSDP